MQLLPLSVQQTIRYISSVLHRPDVINPEFRWVMDYEVEIERQLRIAEYYAILRFDLMLEETSERRQQVEQLLPLLKFLGRDIAQSSEHREGVRPTTNVALYNRFPQHNSTLDSLISTTVDHLDDANQLVVTYQDPESGRLMQAYFPYDLFGKVSEGFLVVTDEDGKQSIENYSFTMNVELLRGLLIETRNIPPETNEIRGYLNEQGVPKIGDYEGLFGDNGELANGIR